MQNLKKYEHLAYNDITTALNEDKLKKINVAGINLSWMNTKEK
jgi:hypothetical protein